MVTNHLVSVVTRTTRQQTPRRHRTGCKAPRMSSSWWKRMALPSNVVQEIARQWWKLWNPQDETCSWSTRLRSHRNPGHWLSSTPGSPLSTDVFTPISMVGGGIIFIPVDPTGVNLTGDELPIYSGDGGVSAPTRADHEGVLSTVLLVLVLLLIIVGTVVGNLLVCVAVCLVRKLRRPYNYLLVSLAVSDLCVAILVMPMAMLHELLGQWQFGRLACDVWVSFDVLSCTASILNLCMISVDRYLAITKPLEYGAKRTPARMFVYISVVWVGAAFISVPPVLILGNEHGNGEVCEVCQNFWYQIYATSCSFYIPLSVMVTVYYKIFMAAKKIVDDERRAQAHLRLMEAADSAALRNDPQLLTYTQLKHVSSQYPSLRRGRGQRLRTIMAPYEDDEVSNCSETTFMTRVPYTGPCTTTGTPCSGRLCKGRPCGRPCGRSCGRRIHNIMRYSVVEVNNGGVETKLAQDAGITGCGNESPGFGMVGQMGDPGGPIAIRDPIHCHLEVPGPMTVSATSMSTTASGDASTVGSRWSLIESNGKLHYPPPIGKTMVSPPYLTTCNYSTCYATGNSTCYKLNHHGSSGHVASRPKAHYLRSQKERFSLAKERKASTTLGIIMSAFVVCWLPFFLTALVKPFLDQPTIIPDSVSSLFLWLGYANSLLNPIIYATLNKDFRKPFQEILCLRCASLNRMMREEFYHSQYGGPETPTYSTGRPPHPAAGGPRYSDEVHLAFGGSRSSDEIVQAALGCQETENPTKLPEDIDSSTLEESRI